MVSTYGRRSIRRATCPMALARLGPMRSRRSIRPCAGTPTSPDLGHRKRELIATAFGLALAIMGCGAGAATTPLAAGGVHVLFIGNSLTYTNDLPRTVEQIAASAGDTIRTRAVALPDFALIDHVN